MAPHPTDDDRDLPEAPADDAGAFPRVFGPYVLLREIGSGGMGRVYEAKHARRGRVEALKVLRSQVGAGPEGSKRFETEVRAIARIDHDHVVTLYDSGIHRGELYYTMPLLSGRSLETLVTELRALGESQPGEAALALLDAYGLPDVGGDCPPAERYARRIAMAVVGVADALAALHDAGVLHRDVKPSNLLLGATNRVLLADFGLARTRDQSLTETGQLLGTPAYMGPEQILERSSELDGRADVYALGATLFELLTFQRPHEGENLAETISLILRKRAPSVRSAHAALPEAIDTLVARCLEKRPMDRYPDAAALRDDLRRFAAGDAIEARPLSRTLRVARYLRRRALPLGAGLLLLTGAVGWYLGRPSYLSVSSIPAASVFVDGRAAGRTPLDAYEVPRGGHTVRIARDQYAEYVKTVDVAHASTYALDVILQALDPASPDARAVAASALGLKRSGEGVDVARSVSGPPLGLVWPRGRLRGPPDALTLFAPELCVGRVALVSRSGTTVASWPNTEWEGRVRLELSDTARAAIVPGNTYVIRTQVEGERPRETTFERLSDDAISQLDTWLERARARFQPDDRSYDFVASEYLLQRELYREALDTVAALAELPPPLGERKEIARLALEILDRAGVPGTPLRDAWSKRFLRWPE